MRMWMIDPKLLCKNHLLGEHKEIHMFVGTIKRGISIKGYMIKRHLDITKIYSRHEELVEEFKKRGYNHKSPLEKVDTSKYKEYFNHTVDINYNLEDLKNRCPACKEKIIIHFP